MVLLRKAEDNYQITFSSDCVLKVSVNNKSVARRICSTDVFDKMLEVIEITGINIEGNKLSELVSEIESIFESGILSTSPKVETPLGLLMYVNGDVVFKRKEDLYTTIMIQKDARLKSDKVDMWYIKLALIKNKIDISADYISDLINLVREDDEENRIVITKENMKEYIDKVPQNIMCTFLSEYFNRRT